jgi:hypothetical protein
MRSPVRLLALVAILAAAAAPAAADDHLAHLGPADLASLSDRRVDDLYHAVLRVAREGRDADRACARAERAAAANPEAARRPDMRARLESMRVSCAAGRAHVEELEHAAAVLRHERTRRMLDRLRPRTSQ